MKTITIWEPWASLIVDGIKDIENRDWYTTYRGPVLIHAGKKYDQEAPRFIQRKFPDLLVPEESKTLAGHIIGIVEIVDCVSKSNSKWFVGTYGFLLKNARRISPIALHNQQGLFDVNIDDYPKLKEIFKKDSFQKKLEDLKNGKWEERKPPLVKIFTSYHSKTDKLIQAGIVPINISRYPLKNLESKQKSLLSLAPTHLMMKKGYTWEEFRSIVLESLDPNDILHDIERLTDGKPAALLCYEKNPFQCHRSIVAEWLKEKVQLDVSEWNEGL